MNELGRIARLPRRLKRCAQNRLFPRRSNDRRQVFSIGTYAGRSPLHLAPSPGANPVLTAADVSDIRARFVADPFMLYVNSTWYMYFEAFNDESGKGEIGLATSGDGLEWEYRGVVLAEPFHLSYPHVYQWLDDFYMIPESRSAQSVRLYKSQDFPWNWQCVEVLLSGERLLDATPFTFGDRWGLFVDTGDSPGDLRLLTAHGFDGPFAEHPHSPVMRDTNASRPAGRVICFDGRLFRFTQECVPYYGTRVRMYEIDSISDASYSEHEVAESPILTGMKRGWNAHGMHHIDAHELPDGRWIACVDGWHWQ